MISQISQPTVGKETSTWLKMWLNHLMDQPGSQATNTVVWQCSASEPLKFKLLSMAELILSEMNLSMIRWELFKKHIPCTHLKCLERESCKQWHCITLLIPREAILSSHRLPDFPVRKEKNSMSPFPEDLNQQKILSVDLDRTLALRCCPLFTRDSLNLTTRHLMMKCANTW